MTWYGGELSQELPTPAHFAQATQLVREDDIADVIVCGPDLAKHIETIQAFATAGAVWQAVVFGFGGLRLTDQGITATPRLPAHWQRLRFKLFERGQQREFVFEHTPPP